MNGNLTWVNIINSYPFQGKRKGDYVLAHYGVTMSYSRFNPA